MLMSSLLVLSSALVRNGYVPVSISVVVWCGGSVSRW